VQCCLQQAEILKQPLQTSVTVDTVDFEDFTAEEMVHIAISVKDFRNMVIHADTVKTSVTAFYSQPSRPLQFVYDKDGMRCEYTLMTIGDFHGSSTPAPPRSVAREPRNYRASANGRQSLDRENSEMPPPQRPVTRSSLGQPHNDEAHTPAPIRSQAEPGPDSLFLPEDDDNQWEPFNQQREEGDILGWEANDENVSVAQIPADNH